MAASSFLLRTPGVGGNCFDSPLGAQRKMAFWSTEKTTTFSVLSFLLPLLLLHFIAYGGQPSTDVTDYDDICILCYTALGTCVIFVSEKVAPKNDMFGPFSWVRNCTA